MEAQSEPAVLIAAEATPFDFESLFHEQYARIAKVIGRILGDPARAEELAVEVFCKLLRIRSAHGAGSLVGYTEPPSGEPWMSSASSRGVKSMNSSSADGEACPMSCPAQ